jgi:tetratricopeptide (TPR) repeat protein
MLEATCLAKLATWACTAAAATLRAHDLELYALLADLGGRTIEAGDALRDRPRDVLGKSALVAACEAVQLYRVLATQRPKAFQPFLAISLNNQAKMLSELRKPEAAVIAMSEAVKLHRALAIQRPGEFQLNLALSLNNMAKALSDLGNQEAALTVAREAVDIRRTLAGERPDTLRPDLATSLAVLADCLEAADQPEPALAADVEAVAALTPAFLRTPQAFTPLMGAVVRDYLRRCEAFGTEPDAALLAPVAEAVAALRKPTGEGASGEVQGS